MLHPRTEQYLRLPYTKRVVPDQGTRGEALFFASVDELPGCESHGATAAEAVENLWDAMTLYIDSLLEEGLDPPRPASAEVNAAWVSKPRA
jgi:predicted RNase H-like HicB family nuclease